MNQNKIVLILPYFGKLPNYFDLWLESLRVNYLFDFLILTDQTISTNLKNVKLTVLSFEEVRDLVQSKFNFSVSLNSPYKLCDFRPAYGIIFEDYLNGYEFWGHCDPDLIFGDLAVFINDSVLKGYDKFYSHGHLTIYRNNTRNNNLVFDESVKNILSYKDVYTTNYACHFDEWEGVSKLYHIKGYSCYDASDFVDVYYKSKNFFDVADLSKGKILFLWENGKLFEFSVSDNDQALSKREIAYVHLQKRQMSFSSSCFTYDKFCIVPNEFIPLRHEQTITYDDFLVYNRSGIYWEFQIRKFKDVVSKLKNGYFSYKYKMFILQFKK